MKEIKDQLLPELLKKKTKMEEKRVELAKCLEEGKTWTVR